VSKPNLILVNFGCILVLILIFVVLVVDHVSLIEIRVILDVTLVALIVG